MVTELFHLKILLAAAMFLGSCVFAFLSFLCAFITDRLNSVHRPAVYRERGCDEADVYENIVRTDIRKNTWICSAGKYLCILLFISAGIFHRTVIEKTGMDLFFSACFILCAAAVYFSLIESGWKESACSDLLAFLNIFTQAAPDFHSGLNMMLSDQGKDIPFGALFSAVRENNPGNSGPDLLRKAGLFLRSCCVADVVRLMDAGQDFRTAYDAFERKRKADAASGVRVLQIFIPVFCLACIFMLTLLV